MSAHGQTGSQGVAGRTVSLVGQNTIIYNQDGVLQSPVGGSLELTANITNHSGTVYYKVFCRWS